MATRVGQVFELRHITVLSLILSVHVQIVENGEQLILDIDAGWQGANHDARIWENSNVKTVIERQRQYLVAGDSGYPISDVLIKPYPNNEALVDPRKADFNRRHSRLRTVSTGNIFSRMKKKYPILKTLRARHKRARKIVIACAILHNIGIRWAQENIQVPADVPPFEWVPIIEDAAPPDVVRERGQILQDQLLQGMDNRGRR